MKAFLSLIRFSNIIIAIFASLVAAYIINLNNQILYSDLLRCIIIISLFMSFGNILNDLYDVQIDKIVHPNRPLPLKKMTTYTAYIIMIIILFFGIASSLYIDSLSKKFLFLVIVPLLMCYSIFLKKIPIINNMVVAFLLASVFLFTSSILIGKIYLKDVAMLVFGLSMIRELIKDIHDYKGDKKYNIRTIPVYYGKAMAYKMLIFIIFIFIVFSISLFFIPSSIFINNIKYLISISILIEIPLLYIVFSLVKSPKNNTLRSFVYGTKLLSILGLLVIIISKI